MGACSFRTAEFDADAHSEGSAGSLTRALGELFHVEYHVLGGIDPAHEATIVGTLQPHDLACIATSRI